MLPTASTEPDLAGKFNSLARDYLGTAPRILMGDTGWLYELALEADGR